MFTIDKLVHTLLGDHLCSAGGQAIIVKNYNN